MEFPKQEHRSGNSQRATVAYRDLVDIDKDAAPGGSSNPDYTTAIATDARAEVLQVSGGEFVRGIQVEGVVDFVVSIHWVPGLDIHSRCMVTVNSGAYSGQVLYTKRIHFETGRSRRRGIQLHCSGKK